jgi:hypothetical protein
MIYADSTIAMSAYNVLAEQGGCANKDSIFATLLRRAHEDLGREQFERAFSRLRDKNLIVERDGRWKVADVRRQLIKSRNREDMIETADGTIVGGWDDWAVAVGNGQLVPLRDKA